MAILKPKTMEKAERLSQLMHLIGAQNGRRALILVLLKERGRMSVGSIAEELGMSVSGVSQHLTKLKPYGLVKFAREAQEIFYSLDGKVIEEADSLLRELLLD